MPDQLKLDPELQIMLDRTPPFTVSIEPVNRPTYAYGYHLGHDELVAKNFVQRMWRDYDSHHAQGLYTIALMKDGKIHDVYDGRDWFSDTANAMWDEAAKDYDAELSSGVKVLRCFQPTGKPLPHLKPIVGLDEFEHSDAKIIADWTIADTFAPEDDK